jgi:hypothetical protein
LCARWKKLSLEDGGNMVRTVLIVNHRVHAGFRYFVARFVDLLRSGCALHLAPLLADERI